jgi:hypothetical protein
MTNPKSQIPKTQIYVAGPNVVGWSLDLGFGIWDFGFDVTHSVIARRDD